MRKRLFTALAALVVSTAVFSAQDTPDLPPLPGHIAYIAPDYNVGVIASTPEGITNTRLTSDAQNNRRYQWVTWATDGRLAYFCCDARFTRGALTLEAYISSTPTAPGKLIYSARNEAFTYAYWSPADCDEGDSCRELAVLVSRLGAPFKLELIRDSSSQPSTRTAGTGAPFYFSWSPDGQRMAWQRNNQSFSVFSLSDEQVTTPLTARPGIMQAPQWSPVSDDFIVVVANADRTNDIAIVSDQVRLVQTNLDGVISTAWSPNGEKIAYSVLNRNGQSALVVVSATNGEVLATHQTTLMVAFFWSPDSERIAFITPAALGGNLGVSLAPLPIQQNQLRLSWSVMDVATESIRTFSGFTPTDDMIYLLSYFDQFAQSHRLWSPDSRYLVYGEITDTARPSVTVLDTQADGQVTYSVVEGSIGVWSFD